MLVNIDQKVLRGEAFQSCIEMDFEILQDDPFLHEPNSSPNSGADPGASPGPGAGGRSPGLSAVDSDADPRFLSVRGNAVFLTELLFSLRYILDQVIIPNCDHTMNPLTQADTLSCH